MMKTVQMTLYHANAFGLLVWGIFYDMVTSVLGKASGVNSVSVQMVDFFKLKNI